MQDSRTALLSAMTDYSKVSGRSLSWLGEEAAKDARFFKRLSGTDKKPPASCSIDKFDAVMNWITEELAKNLIKPTRNKRRTNRQNP